MAALPFDTLQAATRLKDAGFDEKQAYELVSTLAASGGNVATKDDIDRLENRFDAKIEAMGQKMTIRLGSLIVAGVAFLAVLLQLFG